MRISEITPGERVKDVSFTEHTFSVDLLDGRTITVPLVWYPRLLHATPEQRAHWHICGGGYGIHWPDLDEDLSTEGLLLGAPAPRRNVFSVANVIEDECDFSEGHSFSFNLSPDRAHVEHP